jgi:hypothetical protein
VILPVLLMLAGCAQKAAEKLLEEDAYEAACFDCTHERIERGLIGKPDVDVAELLAHA